ncbi:MAG: BLUF domain-containing protein [Acidimicrobiales bacterium]
MSLMQITYTSKAFSDFDDDALTQLTAQAWRSNAAHGITGALYYADRRFIQVIEGEQTAVVPLFAKILTDPRHFDVQTVSIRPVERRHFPEWGMGQVNTDLTVTGVQDVLELIRGPGIEWPEDALEVVLQSLRESLELV